MGIFDHDGFVDERLIKGTKSFFAPIKKVKLNTGIIRVKKPIKAISVLKEDRQAFGLIISKAVSLKEAFSFPITSVPLSISTPEGNLRQSEKASFRNFLISKCDGPFSIPPKNAAWFVDGLAAVRTLKPKKTYREWLKNLLHFLEPPADASPRLIGMINDMYLAKSVKEGTRSDRGSSSTKVTLQGFEQHMPQGVRWSEFLHNGENKNELIKLIARFVQSEEGRSWLKYPFIVTEGTQTYRVEKSQSMFLYSCNHEEADTRLVLHAVMQESDVVIVSKDTDVLVLLIWAFTNMQIKHRWFYKFDHEKFVEVRNICRSLGQNICSALPVIHAITGCDTTSYFYRAGKTRILKKLINDESKCQLIESLGNYPKLGQNALNDAREFIRTIVYNGKNNESFVDTRIRLYQQLKKKTSLTIPPDPDSTEQAIKRCHLQVFVWKRCCDQNIDMISYEENGWKDENNSLAPKWFTGKQLPPSLSNKRKREKSYKEHNSDADAEASEVEPTSKRKTRKRNQKTDTICNPAVNHDCPYEGDFEMDRGNSSQQIIGSETSTSEKDEESEWEVSDFLSSDDSVDEWLP